MSKRSKYRTTMEKYSDKICWCCLKIDENMTSLMKTPLRQTYYSLIGKEETEDDLISQWLCIMCSKEIQKARGFQKCAKISYTLLSSLQAKEQNFMEAKSVHQKRQELEIKLPALSRSILEVWCTSDCENDDDDSVYDAEDSNANITEFKVEFDGEQSCKSDAEIVIKQEPKSPEHLEPSEQKTKVKVKKSKKNKKKKRLVNSSKLSKLKSDGIVKQNRRVVETMQYKVLRLTKEEVLEEKNKSLTNLRYIESPYKCEICIKGFNYEDVLKTHMVRHEVRPDYLECDICHRYLPNIRSLRDHAKSHYVRYKCRECDEIRVSRQHLIEHHSLQHGISPPIQYTCEVCGKTMFKRTMFQKHIKQHNPAQRLPCGKCDKSFKSLATLRAHRLTHGEDAPARDHTQTMKYKCPDCPKQFRFVSLLDSHRVSHASTRNYYCVECDLCFKTQNGLQIHLNKTLKHLDPDSLKYKCNDCEKRYATEKQLQQHIDYLHLGKKLFDCQVCNKKYATKDSLRSHNRKAHPPSGIESRPLVANHICDICSKAFMTKSVLVKHIRTHTGEKPFQCAECLRSFSQKSTLCTHIKLLHENKRKKLVKPTDREFDIPHLAMDRSEHHSE